MIIATEALVTDLPPPYPYSASPPTGPSPVPGPSPEPPEPPVTPFAPPWPNYYASPPPYAPPDPKLDGFAITSLVFGLIGGVLFSVGFGIAALARIRRRVRRGKGLAVAGLVLSGIWIIAFVGLFAYRAGREPSRNNDNRVTRAGQISPTALQIGDCVQVPRVLTGNITSLEVVPCSDLHNGQEFTSVTATATTYPGPDALEASGLADCRQASASFLGTSQTLLHVVVFVPLADGWSRGDREERCLLVDRQKDITGDIRADR